MILVTVGMQVGFDRLIRAMDALAPSLGCEVIAQIGVGSYEPQNMVSRQQIGPSEFEELVAQSQLIVSHAGIGTILTAQRFSTPIVLFPRRLDHGEHRNDHQVATVNNLRGRSGLIIAMEKDELPAKIAEGLQMGESKLALSATAQRLHSAIENFIENGQL